jgi:predicted alpha/beta-hydrolase family hydrolase
MSKSLLTSLLWSGPIRAPLTVILAHGAGAPMDSPFMNFFAEGLAARGTRVGRFEFPYMAARRSGVRKAPDRLPVLLDTWRAICSEREDGRLVIGGKSMGGRIASLVADDCRVAGLVCLGYPFVGIGKTQSNRTEHLATLKTPTLICQGTRDPMGDRARVSALALSPAVAIRWLEDGDHDFKPRRASGRTHAQNLDTALDACASFLAALR